MRVPGELIPIMLFACIAVTIIGAPIARAFARRIESQPREPNQLPEVSARLDRMEQALDSIAIEIERISEGQRFTTKLLADRAASAPQPPGKAS
ncbi:MAG: hypothetical protein ACREPM_23265 [Gemmatimonadaceae bacterium]